MCRYTLNGNRCILPVLARTEIWTDCIPNEYGSPVCEVDDGSWEECETDGEDFSRGGEVTTPLGGVCWTGPRTSAIGQAWNACNEPLVCAAAPISAASVQSVMSGSSLAARGDLLALNATSGTLGICIPKPLGMSWAPILE